MIIKVIEYLNQIDNEYYFYKLTKSAIIELFYKEDDN